ncbi:MAG: hypothetical protein DRJ41_00065 [Thermoprotei archaeon]|nr:MAG: hypothetical protein DRJ41_00065 [Thermoprotei archaeon]
MRAAIIGAGGMGSWFIRYLRGRGAKVAVYDVDKRRAVAVSQATGSIVANSFEKAVKGSEILLLATPISTIPVLVEKAMRIGFEGLLIEISSIKHRVISQLKAFKGRPLSMHPLFGPGLADVSKARCVLVPVRDLRDELRSARKVFPDFKFEVMSKEEHDRSVAIAISLVYAINLAYISLLVESPIALKVEGTTGKIQRLLTLAVLANSPRLIVELIEENPFLEETLLKFNNVLSRKWDIDSIKSLVKRAKDLLGLEPSKGYEWMYKALSKGI